MMEIQGLGELTADLGRAAGRAFPAIRAITIEHGNQLRDEWKSNARETSGKHGKLYPSSITSEDVAGFAVATMDIGPESKRKQGGMGRGFEYGSVNQPPHLDGMHATEATEPRFHHAIELAIENLL